MHLSASRSYDCPLRCGSILTVATGRMMLAISEGFAAETRSYADFTQSRSRKNLEASINGAAGVYLQVAVHASHGESGLAEWPGFSQNTAKCISGPRMETSAPRADVFPEGPVPWPLFLTIIYFYQARQGCTVLYCQRLRRASLSRAKQSFIHYYVSDVFWSCPRVRVRLCTSRIVEIEVEVLTASAFSDAKLDHQFSLKTLVHQVSLRTVQTIDVQAEDPNIPHSHSLCWQLLLEPLIRPAQRDHHLQR
jgi:hypothetical protein